MDIPTMTRAPRRLWHRCTAPVARAPRIGGGLAAMVVASLVVPISGTQAQRTLQRPVVTVKQGKVAGAAIPGGMVYYDIPYAAPPIGTLRWRPPAAAAAWNGVRSARRPGAACMQPDQGWNAVDAARQNEDCLYLNIWMPSGKGPHPVMVWFHGGAFLGGAGNTPLYDGAALMRRGVVLVTVNYRLGVFGYLAHPELTAESPTRSSGNYGLRDQIAALGWIRRNVAAFGGDASNVTIFGQSAGSASASLLLVAPSARGLMRRAILESGTPYGLDLATTLARAQTRLAGFGPIAELRTLPAGRVMDRWTAYAATHKDASLLWPIVDGTVITRSPATSLAAGAAKGIDVIVGSNVRELPSPMTAEQLAAAATRAFGPAADRVLRAYAANVANDPAVGDAATQFATDTMFRCGSIRMAQVARRAWLYHFAQPGPGQPAVRHSSDLPYVFGTAGPAAGQLAPRRFDAAEQRLSGSIEDYWTNFARTGDPNGAGLPIWPAYAGSMRYLRLSAAAVEAKAGLRSVECAPLIAGWAGQAQAAP